MNEPKRDFMKALLAQDKELNSATFDEQRRQILARLAEAEAKEKRSRKLAVIMCGACFLTLAALTLWGVLTRNVGSSAEWPEWFVKILALVIILFPLSTLLICSIYLFRYRAGFIRLQKEAYQQTLLAFPRQIKELREQLDALRLKQGVSEGGAKPSDNAKEGFTLTELLVVVAIIAILVALLLPALSAAKLRARATTCRNNLKQIGAALTMYESEFQYYPGAGDAGIVLPEHPWAQRSTNSWIARISSLLGETVFLCPEDELPELIGQIKHDSFGYNAGGSTAIYHQMEKNLGLGFGHSNFVASSGLRAPADMVAVGDVQFVNSVWCNVVTPNKQTIGGLLPMPSRHGGGANMLFTDSHVEWGKQSDWIADKEAAKARWNNDHEPHSETW